MPLNVGNLVPASLKSKEVATQEYVDNGILNSGYVLPEEVAQAINTNTTTIDGAKITTGSINASDIATGVLSLNGLALFSPPAGYSGTIADQDGVRVYNNGVLRVKLGRL